MMIYVRWPLYFSKRISSLKASTTIWDDNTLTFLGLTLWHLNKQFCHSHFSKKWKLNIYYSNFCFHPKITFMICWTKLRCIRWIWSKHWNFYLRRCLKIWLIRILIFKCFKTVRIPVLIEISIFRYVSFKQD